MVVTISFMVIEFLDFEKGGMTKKYHGPVHPTKRSNNISMVELNKLSGLSCFHYMLDETKNMRLTGICHDFELLHCNFIC